MRTTPVVNSHPPPTHRFLGTDFASKGQGFANLSGTHQPGSPVAALDGRGVGDIVAQTLQSQLNPLFAAMCIADFHLFESIATLVLDDLDMSSRAGNAKAGFGVRSTRASSGWIVRTAEYLGK